MLEFVPLYTRIWEDKKFRNLSSEAQLVFLFFFGNEKITLTGIYEIEASETRVSKKLGDKFDIAFSEIIAAEMIMWDEKNEMIWVVNRFKLIPSSSPKKSPKVIAGVMNELNQISHPFKEMFIKKYDKILEPEMWRLIQPEKPVEKDYFIRPDVLINLSKHYDTKRELKRFVCNRDRTQSEQKLDILIAEILPNLKP